MLDEPGRPVCVFCRSQPVEAAWRPFCSERCKLQDLARWADGTYRVPGEQQEQGPRSTSGTPEEDSEL
jgi:endogenous inhibitor of DNA gyrase (YacG/DUF329 family)